MKEINKGLVTKKLGMSQVFNADGEVVQVTVLQALENVIVQKKLADKDGYQALQVGVNETKEVKLIKPVIGQFKDVKRFFKKLIELRLTKIDQLNIGDNLNVTIFDENEKVNVSGVTKGKGFTGCVKRHNFTIGPISHGSKHHRRGGSNGAGTGQGKVWKGQKMPGHDGHMNVTVKNLKVVKVLAERNIIMVKGAVPGPVGQVVKVYN